MKYIFFLLNILFFSKKIYKKPETRNFLIINGDQSNFIAKYLKDRDYHIVFNRFTRGIESDSEINLFVLIHVLINFKFSIKDYINFYIKFSKPKVVITLIDNDIAFYELKSNLNFKKVLIQNSYRSTQQDIFYKLEDLKKKKYECDYILVFNKHVGRLYNTFLKGQSIQIGPFRSNSIPKKNKEKKYDIIYISNYRGHNDKDIFIKKENITWGEVRKGEEIIISYLKKFIQENENINLLVLGRRIASRKEEFKYFQSQLKGINFEFIPREIKRETYQILDQANVLISIDSTLGYESISRGNKICVFSTLPNKYPTNSSKFGWPANLSDRGFFWTNSLEYSEFLRVIKDTLIISDEEYFKYKTGNIIPEQIIRDPDNKIFQKLISEIVK